MKRVIKYLLAVPFVVLLLLTVLGPVSIDSYAKGAKAKGPKCKYIELGGTKIIAYNCDRFQSKGDKDSITPQVKIIEPAEGEEVAATDLIPICNEDDEFVGRALPITIVVNPEFTIDFTQASSARDEYLFLPQVDGVGHLHAYVAEEINVSPNPDGSLTVDFLEDERADANGGFCVFRNADPVKSTDDYQYLEANCLLQALPTMEDGTYRVNVDFTENSHGPRMKNHPRDMPPGDQVVILFDNDLEYFSYDCTVE